MPGGRSPPPRLTSRSTRRRPTANCRSSAWRPAPAEQTLSGHTENWVRRASSQANLLHIKWSWALFNYMFGDAIHLPGGGSYIGYLLPGIFVAAIFFGATTAAATATDLSDSMIDRFGPPQGALRGARWPLHRRSGPQHPCCRAGARRRHLNRVPVSQRRLAAVAAMPLVVAFGFASIWLFALVGLLVRTRRPPSWPGSCRSPCSSSLAGSEQAGEQGDALSGPASQVISALGSPRNDQCRAECGSPRDASASTARPVSGGQRAARMVPLPTPARARSP
jgi:hypothetical protein